MTQIAVVGAGIAGLNATLTLHDAGLSCTIYEASNRIGGQMSLNMIVESHKVVPTHFQLSLTKSYPGLLQCTMISFRRTI